MTDSLYIEQLLEELEGKGLVIRDGKTTDGRERIYLLNPVTLPVSERRRQAQIRREAKIL